MTDNEIKFLIGLEKLTKQTGVKIGGCGCCGSPWYEEIENADKGGYVDGHFNLEWLENIKEAYESNDISFIVRELENKND